MELLVLDTSFNAIHILDIYESLIWTDRYAAIGDFEFYISANQITLTYMKSGYYLWLKESDKLMIIEDIQIDTGSEDGHHIIVSGRSLESILTYRIIWLQTILTGNFQSAIQKLLNENIINPTIPKRKINNFIFETSTDPRITALTIDAQYTGEELYKVIEELCAIHQLGFKITLNNNNQFVFKLYFGVDRTYDQFAHPYVIFSPEFENIIESSYLESTKTLKTVVLVAGEGEGNLKKTQAVELNGDGGTGIARRELYVMASDKSTKSAAGTVTAADYLKQLSEQGKVILKENDITKVFESEVDFTQMFKYGVDFFMGDIVEFRNEYGMESKSRVTEMVYSRDDNGSNNYPTFVPID